MCSEISPSITKWLVCTPNVTWITSQWFQGLTHTETWLLSLFLPWDMHYFAGKGPYSQSYGFSIVMYGCESCTIKKPDAFELWCWRRLLRVPWTARRLNQSILREINPEYSLEGLMLKLKLQYFGHLIQRADSFEKTLMLGKIEGRRRRVQ